MKTRKIRRTRSNVPDIAGAEKKLRQAEFFLWGLENASKEIARERFRGVLERTEHLEFFFSACLSAAKSVYFILTKIAGRKFEAISQEWRNGLEDDRGAPQFDWMLDLRDDDVHFGETGAKPLEKYVEDDHWDDQPPYHHSTHYNAAIFGSAPVVEMENPDGKKVRGPALRGAVGLYLDRDGRRIEATTACREFIEQLRSLIVAVGPQLSWPKPSPTTVSRP